MDKMLSIAEEQGIIVQYHDFTQPTQGVYWEEPGMPPIIGLSKALIETSSLLRCIMAEELGHHFTCSGTYFTRKFYHYTSGMTLSKVEYKALRWAANYLIPENDLLDVVCSGLFEPWEIAEHFNVTEEIARLRLRIFGARLNF